MKHSTKRLSHIAILLVMFLASLNASADIINTGKRFYDTPEYIPPQLTANNQSILYLRDYVVDEDGDNTDQCKFTIFNASFEEVNTFTTPDYNDITDTCKVYAPIYKPSNVREGEHLDYGYDENVNEEYFIRYCQRMGYNKRQDKEGEVWMLSSDESDYFWSEYFGDKYPERFYIFKNGNIYKRSVSYDYEYILAGHEETPSEKEIYYYTRIYDIDFIIPNNYDDSSFYLSQTLFNNDKAYEWIIPTYTETEVSFVDDINDYKIEGKLHKIIGFKVVSDNGTTVANVELPSECSCDRLYFDLYDTEAGKFLFVNCFNDFGSNRDGDWYVVYKVDAETSTIKAIGAPRKVSVSPTGPKQGTPVNVNLGEAVGNDTKVSVVSVAGRTELVQTIKPGSTETVIDTDRLERGVYVVVVDDGISKREATKIVVR